MRYARRTTVFLCRDAVFAGLVGALFITVTFHSFYTWEQIYSPWFLLALSTPILYGIFTCRKTRAIYSELSGGSATDVA
jgi:hypothetical protein